MPVAILYELRCRTCRTCLRRRAWEWRQRAAAEIAGARRTWFGTLTLKPDEHYLADLRTEARLAARGVKLAELSAHEQFAERHTSIGYDLTRWLKRVRKLSGAKLRFCLVAEAHKSGLPHYHALIHELDAQKPVTRRQLGDNWKLGFSNFKLVDSGGAANYVTKYLSKSSLARVRASLRYGKDALSLENQFRFSFKSDPPPPNTSVF